jgi:xylulokinase
MKKKVLIGVDLGTSATKSAVYLPDGSLVAQASVDVPIYYPAPGVVEQDNEDFYVSAAATVKECMQKSGLHPNQVAAIAFDSQMAGIGSVDEEFKPVTRFDSWLDMRCQPYIDWMDQQVGDRVTLLTGCPPTCAHGPKMLWWQHECPQEFKRIARFLTPAGYVAGRLVGLKGEQAFMDATFIHFSGFSDAEAGKWSIELVKKLGMEYGKLPRIVEPVEIIGEVTERAAVDFGLAPGTLVAAGCGDTAANALGAGVVRPGMLFDVAGTAAVLAACTDVFVSDNIQRALLTMRSVIPGLWYPLAYIAGGGLALRWFRDRFYNMLHGELQESDNSFYDEMIHAVLQVPVGAEGLMFSPHLGGRICPSSPQMRGAWLGFSWGHTQAHFFRAILESIAYEYAYYLSILREKLPNLSLTEARVIGGGARSPIWNGIKADVLGVPYQRLQRNEFGTWGVALVAGKAVGIIDNLKETAMKSAILEGEPLQPDSINREIYNELSIKYIEMQQNLVHFYQKRS